MSQATIQSTLDSISTQQVPNQFGSQRYAILFEPGTYGSVADPLDFQVGYYTEVAGLGAQPSDVIINGAINVFNQCTPSATPGPLPRAAARQLLAVAVDLTLNVDLAEYGAETTRRTRGILRRRCRQLRRNVGRVAGRADAAA